VHLSYKDGIALAVGRTQSKSTSTWTINRPLKITRPSKWLKEYKLNRFRPSVDQSQRGDSCHWTCDLSRDQTSCCVNSDGHCVVFKDNQRIVFERKAGPYIKVAKFMNITHDEFGELILLGDGGGSLRCFGLECPEVPIASWTTARSTAITDCACHRYDVNKTLIAFTARDGGLYAVHFEAESEEQYLAKFVDTMRSKSETDIHCDLACVAISSDGRSLATGGGANDCRVRLYDISRLNWNNKRSAAQITGDRQHRNRVELVCDVDWPSVRGYHDIDWRKLACSDWRISGVQFAGNECVVVSIYFGALFYILLHNGEYRSGRLLTTHEKESDERLTSLSYDNGILVVGSWGSHASVHDLRGLMHR